MRTQRILLGVGGGQLHDLLHEDGYAAWCLVRGDDEDQISQVE